jgi:hypothetical protein
VIKSGPHGWGDALQVPRKPLDSVIKSKRGRLGDGALEIGGYHRLVLVLG